MSLFQAIALPYPASCEQFFECIQPFPWSIWLDSGFSHQDDYHIMTACPAATLVDWPGRSSNDPASLLTRIRNIEQKLYGHSQVTAPQQEGTDNLNDFEHQKIPTPGVIGFISYHQGEQWMGFEYRSDDIQIPLVALGFYTWIVAIHPLNKTCTLVYDSEKHTPTELSALFNTAASNPQPTQKPFTLVHPFISNLNETEYQAAFEQLQSYLISGECYQINLAKRLQAKVSATSGDIWPHYCKIKSQHPNPYSAFAHYPFGKILSFSPESFLHLDANRQITTKPIKGTMARANHGQLDSAIIQTLRRSEKNRAENVMIVDLLRNDLSQVSLANSVQVPSLFAVESYPTVHHLVSTITGTLKPNLDAWDLLKACSPGGSITGAPKHQAIKNIRALEPHNRHIFCGSLIYKDILGQLTSNLCIRTLLYHEHHLYAWVGSGIVADSILPEEIAELNWKIEKILTMFWQP